VSLHDAEVRCKQKTLFYELRKSVFEGCLSTLQTLYELERWESCSSDEVPSSLGENTSNTSLTF
jgi:hypothetical protein